MSPLQPDFRFSQNPVWNKLGETAAAELFGLSWRSQAQTESRPTSRVIQVGKRWGLEYEETSGKIFTVGLFLQTKRVDLFSLLPNNIRQDFGTTPAIRKYDISGFLVEESHCKDGHLHSPSPRMPARSKWNANGLPLTHEHYSGGLLDDPDFITPARIIYDSNGEVSLTERFRAGNFFDPVDGSPCRIRYKNGQIESGQTTATALSASEVAICLDRARRHRIADICIASSAVVAKASASPLQNRSELLPATPHS